MSSVSIETLPDEVRDLAKKWRDRYEQGKDRHKATTDKANRYYALYRSYRDLKTSYSEAAPRDVDGILRDAQHGFGTELFIPYVFSVVETTCARMLAENPVMKVKPAPTRAGIEALMKAERNSENHRVLLEQEQDQMDYYLTVQDVGKSGLLYGLGVGKTLWEEKWIKGQKVLVPPTVREEGGPDMVVGERDHLVYEGPLSQFVSIWDWIHDPRGHSMDTLRWCIHRTWLDDEEISDRVRRGTWELPAGVELEDLLSLGSEEGRDELWADRQTAAGMPQADSSRKEKLHAVLECHDGSSVTTIIDYVCPVQHGNMPFWHGRMPFSLFRPTRLPEEMLGIGEPEAIEDLQEEMNVLRTQRRDNAQFVLQRPFAYFEGLVDANDFQWGPGVGMPVDGDPSSLLYFPPVQDIPFSGYQEERNLQADIERTTGIDDTTAGGSGGPAGAAATATGVQMVQAAAGVRIASKTKLLEREFVKDQAGQMLSLNQQKILKTTYIPGPPRPDDQEGIERGWSAYEAGPESLAGDFDVGPDAGSMAPPNPVEKLDRATRVWNTFGQDELVDPMKIREFVLTNFGFDNPRSILREPEPTISPDVLQAAAQITAEQLGLDPATLMQALGQNVTQAQQLEEEQAAGAGGAPQQQQASPEAPPPQ